MSWKYEQQQARCQWANECRSGFLSLILICICIRCNAGGDVGILNPHQDLCSNGNPSQIYHTTAGRMNDLCGVAEIEIPQTAGRMSDCFSQFGCDKLSETFWQGKDLSKVTFCVAIQSSFNPLNFKCVPRDISRSFKSCFESQRWSFLGVETSPVWEKMDWSGIMTWSSTRDNAPDPMVIMDWLLSVAQVSRCPPK